MCQTLAAEGFGAVSGATLAGCAQDVARMGDAQPPGESADSELLRLGYFIVRVRRSATHGAEECAGVVERLSTGEKRTFRTSDELARVVEEWSR